MKHSLQARLVILFAAAIIVSVFLIWCINFFYLPSYYEQSKMNHMKDVYQSVDELCREVKWGTITEDEYIELASQLDGFSSDNGMNIYVFSVYYFLLEFKYPKLTEWQIGEAKEQLGFYIAAETGETILDENYRLLHEGEYYKIYRVFNERDGSSYIELISKINDATWIYMRSNYQNIQESADISNRMLTYVGAFVMLLGVIVMFFVSRRYTRPIMRLVNHSKKMSELDFNARYSEDREDEIGILGQSMNVLSEKLEATISELKTANNELKLDIERKREQEEMRNEFLANVSHELKTPLSLIRGYAEGLHDNINEDERSREMYSEVIIDETEKMNTMVKKLLSLNQLEFGNDQVHMERFDIREMLESKLRANEILAKQTGTVLLFSCEEKEPIYVWADEYMIDEVVTNYISNALHHADILKRAEKNEKVIEVKLIIIDEKVRVSVFNTGESIPDEDIPKIWDKFYKVDKARTREYGGNGIGLSIVKAVMEAHNQGYGVFNYDNGVEFWFELDYENGD